MPIPKPTQGESKDEFITRCMGDDLMVKEYPNQDQRYRLCTISFSNHIKAKREIANDKTYNDYPQAATNAAKRALKYREESGNPKGCGTPVGWARANQLAKREPISRETIARMAAFARHLQYEDVPYEEGCGGLVVDAWGSRVGIEWAQRKLKEIDGE